MARSVVQLPPLTKSCADLDCVQYARAAGTVEGIVAATAEQAAAVTASVVGQEGSGLGRKGR